MKQLIAERLAVMIMMIIFSCVLVFHALVISEVIPYGIVWAGKLKSWEEMVVFETISILLNTLMMLIVAIRGKLVRGPARAKWLTGVLWGMAILFGMNTVGNLFAENSWETIIFTPLTFISSLLSIRLAMG